MTQSRHPLLRQRLQRCFSLEAAARPAALEELLAEVEGADQQADDARRLLEQSLELVRQELVQRNEEVALALESATAATFRYSEAADEMVWEGYPLPFHPGRRGCISGTTDQLLALLSSEAQAAVRDALRETLASGTAFTLRLRAPGRRGSLRWLEVRGQARRRGVVSGTCVDITDSVTAEEEARRGLLQTVKSPLLDQPVEASPVLGVSTDVTARQEADGSRTVLQEKLRQSQKLEAIGLLAGGVAHDFNNLLTPILLTAENLLERFVPGSKGRAEAEVVLSSAHAARDLTGQLLAFSRKQVLEMRVVDINEELRRAIRLLGRLMPESIGFDSALHSRPCLVRADPGQLQQVIVNLIINARDAMPAGGRILLQTRMGEERGEDGTLRRQVVMAVGDSGVGMDEATLAQIFEPFFTTKEIGRGTGLGLSTAYGIVQQHKGHISVTSKPGKGATFEVLLPMVDAVFPAAAEPPAVKPESIQIKQIAGLGATLLVVEDEPVVRRLVCEILEAHGYVALAAADSEGALRLCAEYPGELALLVTDVMLPGVNGRELFDLVAKSRPSTRVLYMSGYSLDVLGGKGVLESGSHMLRKPFSPSELLAKVGAALGAGG